MKLPFFVSTAAIAENEFEKQAWIRRFANDPVFNRTIRETVWRRHQCQENQEQSGWKTAADTRKRIIHIRDGYGYDDCLFLEKTYVWLYLNLPKTELDEYENFAVSNLDKIWRKSGSFWNCGNLNFHMERTDTSLTCNFTSYTQPNEFEEKAWRVFSLGVRKKRARGTPQIVGISEILKYAPFHVELGSGPSLETGIPPLSDLHQIYSVQKHTGEFIFNLADDSFFQKAITDPYGLYYQITKCVHKCVNAPLTNFYHQFKRLVDLGIILEPAFTNNFDGLLRDVGVMEFPLFGFDNIYPKLQFKSDSLLVIGSHADRRLVREQARQANMRIFFIDPENYNGKEYLVEDAQDSDFIVKITAAEFANYFQSR